eukprot:GHVT01064651.1.p3 GENE.GHVT01064651.1~~GHVT01064651.1.p3  ORF type:complete len:159 (-),score=12.96 GHVT01064651.1:635-1111(-)
MLDEILGMPRSSDLAEGTGDSTLADETDQLLRKKSKGGRLPLPPLAPLYTGVFVPKSKNLMCLGLQEVQYGVGPPVALAADMIARVVKAQEQVKFPVGDIMKSLRMVHILRRKDDLCPTIIGCAYQLAHKMFWVRILLSKIALLERLAVALFLLPIVE